MSDRRPASDDVPHRKRCKRYNDPGHAHFLTFSCFQRRPFLSRDRTRGWFVDAVNLARERHELELWAYVIMPEHAHLVIFPRRQTYSVSSILTTIKQSVSKSALAYVRKNAPDFLRQMSDVAPDGSVTHRFWQRGGGYDRNLVESTDVWEKIDYTHGNPVKRGLCARPEDWLWSSAASHLGLRSGPLTVDSGSLPARRQ